MIKINDMMDLDSADAIVGLFDRCKSEGHGIDAKQTSGVPDRKVGIKTLPPDLVVVRSIAQQVGSWLLQREEVRRHCFPRATANCMILEYSEGGYYDYHYDAVIQQGIRADYSYTIFLNDDYEGGGLVVDGCDPIRLDKGGIAIYRGGLPHRVNTVIKGRRMVIVGWMQSYIRDPARRATMRRMHRSLEAMREIPATIDADNPCIQVPMCIDDMEACIQMLMREWVET